MRETRSPHPGTAPTTLAAPHGAAGRTARLSGLPLAVAAPVLLAALAGCVPEPQPRATVLRELDTGYTSSNGGGQRYLGNQLNEGVTTRVR